MKNRPEVVIESDESSGDEVLSPSKILRKGVGHDL